MKETPLLTVSVRNGVVVVGVPGEQTVKFYEHLAAVVLAYMVKLGADPERVLEAMSRVEVPNVHASTTKPIIIRGNNG